MVKFFFALICILLLQLSKASCQDKNWIKIPGNFNGNQHFFNCKHIVRGKNTAVVWIKILLCKKNSDALTKMGNAQFKFLVYDEDYVREKMNFKDGIVSNIDTYSFLDGVPVDAYITKKNDSLLDVYGSQFDDEVLAVKKYLHIKN